MITGSSIIVAHTKGSESFRPGETDTHTHTDNTQVQVEYFCCSILWHHRLRPFSSLLHPLPYCRYNPAASGWRDLRRGLQLCVHRGVLLPGGVGGTAGERQVQRCPKSRRWLSGSGCWETAAFLCCFFLSFFFPNVVAVVHWQVLLPVVGPFLGRTLFWPGPGGGPEVLRLHLPPKKNNNSEGFFWMCGSFLSVSALDAGIQTFLLIWPDC